MINQFSLITQITLVAKKEKQKYSKQTKKKQGKKSTNKKWESLSEEWIGGRS